MKINNDIENCTFRSLPKIDWCTLAFPILSNDPQELRNVFLIVLRYFRPITFEEKIQRNHLIARTEGLFIRVIPNSLSLQLQGHFFTVQEDSFIKLKVIANDLSKVLREYYNLEDYKMHVSRFDIYQEWWNLSPEYFRSPFRDGNHFTFTADMQNFEHLCKGKIQDTGFLIKNANWEISCYDKSVENEKQKKIDKKLKMKEYLPSDMQVTRLEVRLTSSKYCLIPTKYLYMDSKSELDICKEALNEFYQHRKFRIPNDKDSHKNRWNENAIWRDIFIPSGKDRRLREILNISKNDIVFNPAIAQRTLSKSLNNAAKIIKKLDEHNLSEVIDTSLKKAKLEVEKREIRDLEREKATKDFYRSLKPSNKSA